MPNSRGREFDREVRLTPRISAESSSGLMYDSALPCSGWHVPELQAMGVDGAAVKFDPDNFLGKGIVHPASGVTRNGFTTLSVVRHLSDPGIGRFTAWE